MDFNIQDFSNELENILHYTTNIETINSIITAYEDAIKNRKKVTEDFSILFPSYEQMVIIALKIEDCDEIIKPIFETCVKLEEYEMCIRIKKMLC